MVGLALVIKNIMVKTKSVLLAAVIVLLVNATEPNPPNWPDSVKIIDPSNPSAG